MKQIGMPPLDVSETWPLPLVDEWPSSAHGSEKMPENRFENLS
jgi:hypothetical protein